MTAQRAEVWILDSERMVLCQTAGSGVPAAAVVASDGTVGGTLFDRASLLGPFDLPASGYGWGEAGDVARAEADRRGYRVEFFDPTMDDPEEEEPE